nr:uncharacterized protein LOC105846301 [Hydra vulgaris]
MVDVIPCFKKNDPTDKCNFCPISILPVFSKVFEIVIYEQIRVFIEPSFNKLLCGFWRGYSAQHALFNLVNKWQECLDKGGIVGAMLMDLSKAYDLIPHDLLIAKLEGYGFSYDILKLLLC